MITDLSLLDYMTAEPFRPFRINTVGGRSFAIRYPEAIGLGRSSLSLSAWLADRPDAKGQWYDLPLTQVKSIEHLDAPALQNNG